MILANYSSFCRRLCPRLRLDEQPPGCCEFISNLCLVEIAVKAAGEDWSLDALLPRMSARLITDTRMESAFLSDIGMDQREHLRTVFSIQCR